MSNKLTIVLKLDQDTKTRLKTDAKKHFRSTTMHIQAIIAEHLKSLDDTYSHRLNSHDMDNL